MATFIVTTADDELDSFGTPSIAAFGGANDISLREAIALANATSGIDEITFDPTVFEGGPGDVIFLSPDLDEFLITDRVAIRGDLDGDGTPDVEISADSAEGADDADSRIFLIGDGDGSTILSVTLDGLVLRDGNQVGNGSEGSGGAIRYDGTLQIVNSILRDNVSEDAGGAINANGRFARTVIYNSSFLSNTALDGGGGAFYSSYGFVTAINSTFTGNRAADFDGGAIYNGNGDITLTRSTLTGNYAASAGGGDLLWRC